MKKYLMGFTMILVLLVVGCSFQNQEANIVPSSNEAKVETTDGDFYELVSVKMSDEPKFSKEEWKKILKQIEKGEVILEQE